MVSWHKGAATLLPGANWWIEMMKPVGEILWLESVPSVQRCCWL